MFLNQIIVAISILLFFRVFFWPKSKNWLLFVLSLIAIYYLQPSSAIRSLSFWFPTLILIISIIAWWLYAIQEKKLSKMDLISLVVILAFPFLFNLLKFIGLSEISFFSGTPKFLYLLLFSGLLILILFFFRKKTVNQSLVSIILISLVVSILVILKSQALSRYLSILLRQLSGQSITLSSADDIKWVGFSYFAFRLIHIIIDREGVGRLELSLRDFITYIVFFPAFTSGPIDRIERFNGELNKVEGNAIN